MKDYYKTLEVSENATEDEIKKSFKKLAKKYHPDINKGNKASEEKFKELSEAYEVLCNKSERRKYDAQRHGHGTYNFNGFSQDGPFKDYFKGRAQGSSPEFSDIFDSIFEGFGVKSGGGDSYFEHFENLFGGSAHNKRRSSPQKSYNLKIPIETAILGGKVEVTGIEKIPTEVVIPANSPNGSIIYSGNKKIVLSVESCDPFKVVGNNIELTICINFAQAVLGSKVRLKAPNKERIILTVPPGTSFNDVFKVKGMGLAGGDLLVKTEIQIPKNLSESEKEQFEAFAKKMNWRF
ncbi:MAG: Curved DNA-binding protein [bacterium ADurb.Bin157]|nr:MAG: Curved DNA-binding protein [bacterium ADurb.Bin157]